MSRRKLDGVSGGSEDRSGSWVVRVRPILPHVCHGLKQDTTDPTWQEIVKSKANHLKAQELDQLLKVLESHDAMWSVRLGKIQTVDHHIPTTGPPISSQPYRAGPQALEQIDTEIQRMLKMDVIEPATSPWSSPIVLIPKPDGSIRFCIDYRKLNAVTDKDSYSLPRIDDCLDSLGDARYFSTLDANCGYRQIGVAPADKEKTTFTSPTIEDCISSSE